MPKPQKEGCYPRVNGGMIQSNQYTGCIVSLVGKVVAPSTLEASDGTRITLNAQYLEDGVMVNPDLCVEIVGQAEGATEVQAFVQRPLSSDMDLGLYNQMIAIQNSSPFSVNFSQSQVN